MKGALIIAIILLVITLPISMGVKIQFNKDFKYINCALYAYRKIKLLKASVKLNKKNLNIYLFNMRFQIEYAKMFKDRKRYDIFKGFEIDELFIQLDIGRKNNKIIPIIVGGLFNQGSSIILSVLKEKNSGMIAQSKLNLHEGEDKLAIKFKISILFNFLLIIIALIKKLAEKISNGKRKAK